MTLHTTPPHPPSLITQTQCYQYLSCYWPDFDETLYIGSWEHLEQILNQILNPNIEPDIEPNIEPNIELQNYTCY